MASVPPRFARGGTPTLPAVRRAVRTDVDELSAASRCRPPSSSLGPRRCDWRGTPRRSVTSSRRAAQQQQGSLQPARVRAGAGDGGENVLEEPGRAANDVPRLPPVQSPCSKDGQDHAEPARLPGLEGASVREATALPRLAPGGSRRPSCVATAAPRRRRIVHFASSPLHSEHAVEPYGVIYGMHPSFFEFTRRGDMELTDRGIMNEICAKEGKGEDATAAPRPLKLADIRCPAHPVSTPAPPSTEDLDDLDLWYDAIEMACSMESPPCSAGSFSSSLALPGFGDDFMSSGLDTLRFASGSLHVLAV